MKKIRVTGIIGLMAVIMAACNNNHSSQIQAENQPADSVKIVSLNGTLSEIVTRIGMEENIVGVDVTSTYPESLQKKAKVGHNRNISAEGVLALQPDVIIGIAKDVKPELAEQFKSAGVKLLLFEQEYSAEGTKKLIQAVADSLNRPKGAEKMIADLNTDLSKIKKPASKPKVLFIYARGTGTMMVAGDDSQVEKVIEMAGGQNAVSGFKDFKPLTAEALVKANPDVILLFDSGMESLGGTNGLLDVQGIAQTNAGKNKRFITMEGQFLTGFGPRLGKAVAELSDKIHGWK